MAKYRKFLVAIGAALAVLIAALTTDDVVTSAEWIQTALAFLGAIGVYSVPNAVTTPPSLESTSYFSSLPKVDSRKPIVTEPSKTEE